MFLIILKIGFEDSQKSHMVDGIVSLVGFDTRLFFRKLFGQMKI